jgi:hypothetical protein
MSKIQGQDGGGVNPSDRKLYELQYAQGAELFQKALEHYTQSDNPYQKEEFRQVMEKAMNILNETAQELKARSLAEQNKQIAQDYATFSKYPESPQAIESLNGDLERAKKSIV